MYSYCGNNPVNRVDETGYSWISTLVKNVAKAIVNTVKTVVNTISNVVKAANTVVNAVNSYNNWVNQPKQKATASMATNFIKISSSISYEQAYNTAYAAIEISTGYVGGVSVTREIFNANQNAVIQLGKEANVADGITMENANILHSWAKEYGVNTRIDIAHIGRSGIFGVFDHLHINKSHIKIFP